MYHIHALHSYKSLHFHSFNMLLVPAIAYILLSLFTCLVTHAWPWHIFVHALHSPMYRQKSQWSPKAYTVFLVTCIGYHGNSYKQTMVGLYIPFSWKWSKIMWTWYPTRLKARKGGLSGVSCRSHKYICHALHKYILLIHHISSMIGHWSIDDKNFYSLEHGAEPSIVF